MQQILHVQRVDAILGVVLDDLVADEQRLVRVRCAETVEGETTGQTGDRAEQRLECLRHVVGNEVLVNLEHVIRQRFSWQSNLRTCIMVMRDCLALANSVSPQTPRSFLS